MLVTIMKRLVTVIPTLIGVVIVTFLLTRVLPGDPAIYFAGPAATPQSIAEVRKSLGLDRPLPDQFLRYVNDLAHGNFGNSLSTGQPVAAEITSRLPASAELTLFGLLLSIVIAVPLGILAAVKQGSWIDHLCRVVATAGVSLPVFFTGLLLVYAFYFRLGWSPAPIGRLDAFATAPRDITGFYLIDSLITGDFETFRASLSQLILPAFTLGIFSLAPIARMTRASMLAVLASDFVRTARASGLNSRTVILTYAFRNAMLPVVTTLGMVFSFLLGANVLVEKVFAWPGIGSYAVEALLQSDFVRTARASGLSPSTVIVIYAFRNAMLPVITTLSMVFSFLLGANVLVEKVFAWPGIGSYAVEALISSDFAPVQGFVLTMAVMYVLLNLMIDILYGVIDPRVRLEG